MISYLSHKYHGEKPHDQIVAIAASECRVSRKNDYNLDTGIRAALQLDHYKKKYPHLTLKEQLQKTYHKIKKTNDFIRDVMENGTELPFDHVLYEIREDLITIDNFDEGWHGEPKRHSKARKTGKADFIEDLNEIELNSLSNKMAQMVRNSEYGIDITGQFEEGSYLFHGTSVPRGILEDRILKVGESLDTEGAIFFTTTLHDAYTYGDTVIAIPIKELKQHKILKNTHGNKQEDLSVMIEKDVEVPENALIHQGKAWWGLNEFEREENPEKFEFEEYLDIKEDDPEEVKELVKNLNKKPEKGQGWHGESERHSKARKTGKADFVEDTALDECTAKGHTKEECFAFFNAARQEGIKGKTSYTGEGLRELDESGHIVLKEMVKELALLPKKLRSDFKIVIYKTFEDKLPTSIRKNDQWLGFWNRNSNEIGFAADKLNFTAKDYARSAMLHEVGHKIYDDLSQWRKEYVQDQYLKFKRKLELSSFSNDKYVSKNANEYFAEMFARANESHKGYGLGIYGEPSFIEYLHSFKKKREDLMEDTKLPKQNIIFIHKKYKNVEYFGYKILKNKKRDLIEDSFDELLTWVKTNIKPNDPESVAYAIINSRKKKGKEEKDKNKAPEKKEKTWKKEWGKIGETFDKQREIRKIDKQIQEKKIRFDPKQYEVLDSGGRWTEKDEQTIKRIINSILNRESWFAEREDREPMKSIDDVLEYIEKKGATSFGSDWYERIRIKPKKIDPLIQKYNELNRQYFELDAKIMESDEPSLPSRLKEKQQQISEKMKILKKEIKKNKLNIDFMEDAVRGPGRPPTASSRAPKAGSPSALVGGAKRTKTGQVLQQAGIPLAAEGTPSVTMPFTVVNSETGEIISGEVTASPEDNTIPLAPVSSSTVKAVGAYRNELLVQFHGTQGTYRYMFRDPYTAMEARKALMESESPGRWIWHSIRGHKAGETITKAKLGPAWGSGREVIGGTSASLISYEKAGRSPVSKAQELEAMSKKMKREKSSPNEDPSTGATIEKRLKSIRELRDKNVQNLFQHLQSRLSTKDHVCDFVMTGLLTRSGKFDYRAEGEGIKIKTPENLKYIAEHTEHVPAFGKRTSGAHQEEDLSLIGYAHEFHYIPPGQVDEYAHIAGVVETFYDIKELSSLDDPRDLPVSFGFDDSGNGEIQEISRLHHLAVSLDKLERDRCSTMGGTSCTISPKVKTTDFIGIKKIHVIIKNG